ncbi:MAG: CPBP family intramembrane metalloprotease [Elusimicrobia bacterium]|nr:CPBP family intramembrane metalloprotease [Elusimicrobiota bacterium]
MNRGEWITFGFILLANLYADHFANHLPSFLLSPYQVYLALFLPLLLYFSLSVPQAWEILTARYLQDWRGLLGFVALLVGLAWVACPPSFEGSDPTPGPALIQGVLAPLSKIALYLSAPAVFSFIAVRAERPRLRLFLFSLTLLWFWLPMEMNWLPQLQVPPDQKIQVNLVRFLALDLGLFLLLYIWKIERVGFHFNWKLSDLGLVVKFYLLLALSLAPLSLLLDFTHLELTRQSLPESLLALLGIYVLVAIPEEFLFRGILQNYLEFRLGLHRGWLLASCIFGLTHLNNPPAPNLRYLLLATLAGLAYGRVYQKTRCLTASALTHALTNWTWLILFKG